MSEFVGDLKSKSEPVSKSGSTLNPCLGPSLSLCPSPSPSHGSEVTLNPSQSLNPGPTSSLFQVPRVLMSLWLSPWPSIELWCGQWMTLKPTPGPSSCCVPCQGLREILLCLKSCLGSLPKFQLRFKFQTQGDVTKFGYFGSHSFGGDFVKNLPFGLTLLESQDYNARHNMLFRWPVLNFEYYYTQNNSGILVCIWLIFSFKQKHPHKS